MHPHKHSTNKFVGENRVSKADNTAHNLNMATSYFSILVCVVDIVRQYLPIVKGIFDVVAGGVEKNTSIIPACTLDPHVLMY